jgi:CRP-like cAMP-binding protein
MNTKTYQAGDLILAEGTDGGQAFLIRSGKVQICKSIGSHEPIPIANLGEGEILGEMFMFEEAGLRTASVIAATEVKVELIPTATIEKAMAETPEIIQALLKTLSSRLAQTSQQNTELQIKSNQISNPTTRQQ